MNKIYIENIPLSKIQSKIKDWHNYLHKEYKQLVFYSKENGIFIEETEKNEKTEKKGNIYYVEPSCTDVYEQYDYLSYKLIIDSNESIKIKVVSQLPVEYIMQTKHIKEYKLHNKSMITLVIIGGVNERNEFISLDFYFECKKNDFNMENIFFQKEFNGFLSLIN